MSFVLDASITLAWCFQDEKTAFVDRIIERCTEQMAWVPALWPLEVANGLLAAERRGRIRPETAAEMLLQVASLPVHVDQAVLLSDLGLEAKIARERRLSMYDAAYLGLAVRRTLPLVTLDQELREAALAYRVSLLRLSSR